MCEWRRIDAIADVRRGASPRPIGDPKYFGGEVGWVRISDVTRASRILRETEQYVSPLGESLSVRVNPGDLVMSICGTLGRPIIIGIPACIHDGFVQFSNLRDADTTFLFYALQHAEPAFYGMGQPGTQTNLNTSLVGRHKIFAPKKEEQRRIAEILSTLDEAIAQTEALIAKHQQIKAGLMHDLFTRGVTPDGHLRPTREQAPDLYKESPLGWIPKEWEVVQLSRLAQFITSGSRGWAEYYNETGPLFIRIGNLSREHINFRWDSVVRVSPPKFTEGQRTAVMPEDILISITADLGIVAVAKESLGEAYVNQHIALIRPSPDGLSSRFIGHFLTTAAVQNQFLRLNDSGAKAGLNLPAVGKILVVRPRDDSESTQMASMIDTCDCNIESQKVELTKLRQQKHGLMHDLLTGRVRVRPHPGPLPAGEGENREDPAHA